MDWRVRGYGSRMAKMVKFALLGGIAGVGIAVYRSSQSPTDQSEDVAADAAKTAWALAASGAVLGLLFDRRAKRKVRKASAFGALKAGSIVEAARIARPAVEHALEIARDRAKEAAETAKPHLEHAADYARDKAKDAADAARPRLEETRKQAKKRAKRARKEAGKRAEKAATQARKRAEQVAETAKERIEERQPILVKVA